MKLINQKPLLFPPKNMSPKLLILEWTTSGCCEIAKNYKLKGLSRNIRLLAAEATQELAK